LSGREPDGHLDRIGVEVAVQSAQFFILANISEMSTITTAEKSHHEIVADDKAHKNTLKALNAVMDIDFIETPTEYRVHAGEWRCRSIPLFTMLLKDEINRKFGFLSLFRCIF
jgi:hypothetical protein